MDTPVNRRQALTTFGTVTVGALLAACGSDGEPARTTSSAGETATVTPSATAAATSDLAKKFDAAAICTQTAEQTEGPYYLDVDAIRTDIREGREGVRLRLGIRVRSAGECEPIKNAVVDIWHADAEGVYSGVQGDDGRFLRGTQVTNADGIVEFETIYPGWYPGRTPHIHAKVHVDNATALTTQLYFDDDVSAEVFAREPYAGRGQADQGNASDGIFDESLILTMEADGDGYLGLMTFDVATA
jgi:protocatechuate 3,4-dioxygenase beta subunit